MPKLGTDTLTGKSGASYTFNVYNGNMQFNDFIPGVYLIGHATSSESTAIYLDQTDNIDVTLKNHEKQDCFEQHQYNRIYFLRNASLEVREGIVADLLPILDPACN